MQHIVINPSGKSSSPLQNLGFQEFAINAPGCCPNAELSMAPGLGEMHITLHLAKISARLFQHLPVWVSRRAGKKGGKARVIDGTQGPEIVYDANMFKSTALPPLGKGA